MGGINNTMKPGNMTPKKYFGKDHIHLPKKGKGSYNRMTHSEALEEIGIHRYYCDEQMPCERPDCDNCSGCESATND